MSNDSSVFTVGALPTVLFQPVLADPSLTSAGWYYDHNQRDESLTSTATLASTLSSTLRAANHIGSTALQATRRSLIGPMPGNTGRLLSGWTI